MNEFFTPKSKTKKQFSLIVKSACLLSTLVFLYIYSPYVLADVKSLTQSSETSPEVTESLIKVMIGLSIVILSIFGSAWFFRRFGNINTIANDSLKIVGGLSIGQKEKIILIQVGEEQILVAVSQAGMRTLHVLAKPIEFDSTSTSQKNSFSTQLNTAIGKWQKNES